MEKCLEGNIRGKCCGMCLWVEHPIWESGNDPNGVLFHTMYLGALKALRNPVLSLCRVFLLLLFFFFLICSFVSYQISYLLMELEVERIAMRKKPSLVTKMISALPFSSQGAFSIQCELQLFLSIEYRLVLWFDTANRMEKK